MIWWLLILIFGAVVLSLYGIFRWASADPEIDRDNDKERFQEEQSWRALRRARKL